MMEPGAGHPVSSGVVLSLLTVTVKLHPHFWPVLLSAVHVTRVTPMGKQSPESCEHPWSVPSVTTRGSQVTTAQEPPHTQSTIWLSGQSMEHSTSHWPHGSESQTLPSP